MGSLFFMLGGQYDASSGTWTMTFIAPDANWKMRSYAVGVKNGDPLTTPTQDEIMAIVKQADSSQYVEL
jgi:hypothetical protein